MPFPDTIQANLSLEAIQVSSRTEARPVDRRTITQAVTDTAKPKAAVTAPNHHKVEGMVALGLHQSLGGEHSIKVAPSGR